MRPLALVALVALAGCASSGPTADPAVLTTADTFADYLQREGLNLQNPAYASTTSFLGDNVLAGSIVSFVVTPGPAGDPGVVSIYPFRSIELAEGNTFRISEDQAAPGIGGNVPIRGEQRTYQRGQLVVVYRGTDATVRSTLRAALGRAKRRTGQRDRNRDVRTLRDPSSRTGQ